MANDGDGDEAGGGEAPSAHPSLAIQSLEAGRITEAEGHAYEAYIKRGREIESEIETLKISFLAAMAKRQRWAGQIVTLDEGTVETNARPAEKRARASAECEHDFIRRAPSYNGEFEYICEQCGCRDSFG